MQDLGIFLQAIMIKEIENDKTFCDILDREAHPERIHRVKQLYLRLSEPIIRREVIKNMMRPIVFSIEGPLKDIQYKADL